MFSHSSSLKNVENSTSNFRLSVQICCREEQKKENNGNFRKAFCVTHKHNKEYLKRYRTKNEEKYKKADSERKQYEKERLKYLEHKKYEKHLQGKRNRIQIYRQKKVSQKISNTD